MSPPHVLLYYSHYILNDNAGARHICRISMLYFAGCTFTAFLCLAPDGPVSAECSSDLLPIWDSGFFVSLPLAVSETLMSICAIVLLHESSFHMSLEQMAHYTSPDVYCVRYTSSWFPHSFPMGEMFDVPSCNAFSTRRHNVDGVLSVIVLHPLLPCFLYQ